MGMTTEGLGLKIDTEVASTDDDEKEGYIDDIMNDSIDIKSDRIDITEDEMLSHPTTPSTSSTM